MPLKNENVLRGLQKNAPTQIGRSDLDLGLLIEDGVPLPWPSDPLTSWVYYDCTIAVVLDSGIVVHNRLPQVNNAPDTLASCKIDDPNLDSIVGPGVNLKSNDQYTDIVQRMGHSRYWFRLYGQALRVGYQVPIPSIKTIGGVAVTSYDRDPQWAFNRIAPGANYAGVILWHAAWSLWYTTTSPPRNNTIPAADALAHTSVAEQNLADGIQSPFSAPDDDAVKSAPSVLTTTGTTRPGGAGPGFITTR